MKKIFELLILISLIGSPYAWTAAAQTEGDVGAEKVKDEVSNHARLPIRKIAVRLKNGTKLKGVPTDVEDESFVLFERETGRRTVIKYADVAKVHRTGVGLSGTQKKTLMIGAVAAASVLFIVFKPKPKPCDLRRLFC